MPEGLEHADFSVGGLAHDLVFVRRLFELLDRH